MPPAALERAARRVHADMHINEFPGAFDAAPARAILARRHAAPRPHPFLKEGRERCSTYSARN
jgi:hypothetical protein